MPAFAGMTAEREDRVRDKIKIAIPTGDPAGIGPEIALKTALDPAVREACDPILVSDPDLLMRQAEACGIGIEAGQAVGQGAHGATMIARRSAARLRHNRCPTIPIQGRRTRCTAPG